MFSRKFPGCSPGMIFGTVLKFTLFHPPRCVAGEKIGLINFKKFPVAPLERNSKIF
jgi:hypothetical protein